jgi:hypothetical protein
LNDLRDFLVTVLSERSVRSRNCLSPKGEFCGCSAMSLELSGNLILSEKQPSVSLNVTS